VIKIESAEQITGKKREVHGLVAVRQTPPALIQRQELFEAFVVEPTGYFFLKVRPDSDCKPRRSAEFLRFIYCPTLHACIQRRQPSLWLVLSRVSMNPRRLPPLRLRIGSAICSVT
jgi:hypothetical protein